MIKKNGHKLTRMPVQSQSESNGFFMKITILLYFAKSLP